MELLEALLRVRQVMAWPQLYLDGLAVKNDVDPEPWTGRCTQDGDARGTHRVRPKEKALVFAQWMGEMDRIQELLAGESIETYRIDGSVPKSARRPHSLLQKSAEGAVFDPGQGGGVGLNLQEATRVYITAPTWNPAMELQAIGRAHRTESDPQSGGAPFRVSGSEQFIRSSKASCNCKKARLRCVPMY
jgi:SNF2 family DNA or RNA helicase